LPREKQNQEKPTLSGAYPPRAKVAVAIVLVMAELALGSFLAYRSYLRRQPNTSIPDTITADERRFDGLRAVLPFLGTVGYLSDIAPEQESVRKYYLTQYFLAPVVVAPDTKRELVVANFDSPSAIAALASANGLTVERDFQNGVALLRRAGRSSHP